MPVFNEGVDAREQDREQRRHDGAPERERENADAAAQTTAHRSGGDAGLNDRQGMQRARYEQDGCPRRPSDVLVRDVEALLHVDGRAQLRETHDLRRL